LFKLLKKETRKLWKAFLHPTFLYLVLVGNTLLIFATILVYFLEKDLNPRMKTYFDSLWWGVSTITTVGFGDTVPLTLPGRIMGIVLMYSGTILFISFTGILVTRWMREEVEKEFTPIEKEIKKEEKEQERIERKLNEILSRLERLEKR
jgi:voltage-gated potassium channel